MFKNQIVGRLGLFLSISVLTSACGVGEIGDSAGEPRFDVGFSDATLTCPGVSADVSASDGWESKEASQSAPDGLFFEVMARPTEANLDALLAVGAQDIHELSDAAIAVRFSETGLVDVMDDTEYSSDGLFEYEPGVWYNIAISADVATRTYDVEIGRCGEKRQNVRRGATFRSAANVYDRLSNWGVWSSQRAALELSTPTWMASGTCAPSTCEALGAECGQPSDGCNGTLNCGVCGGGQFCSSSACVDEPVSVPPPPSCTPASCQSLGAECGAPSDGCGGTLNCGGCGGGQLCSNNVCADQPVAPPPPPPACVPTTCQALGADCGVRSNGCGGTLNCGGCGAGQLCSDSLCIDQPVAPPPPGPDPVPDPVPVPNPIPVPVPVPEGAYYAENFDTWPDGGCPPPYTACDGASIEGGASVGAFPQCLSGKCWRGVWNGNESSCHFAPEDGNQLPAYDTFYGRIYIRFGADFSDGAPYNFKLHRLISNAGAELNLYYLDETMVMDNPNAGSGCPDCDPVLGGGLLCQTPFVPEDRIGEWVKLEWFWKHNTAGRNDGECHLWVTYGDGSVDESHMTSLKLYPNPAGIDRSAWIFANVSNYGAWPYDTKTIYMDEVCIGDSISDRTSSCATE